MKRPLAGTVYLGLQGLRGGVTQDMMWRAAHLLARPWEEVAAYVDRRLASLHGDEANRHAWLAAQTPVDRTELIGEFARIRERRDLKGIDHRKTSGSTGTPFHFVKHREMTAWMDAAMWAVYAWHGVEPGARQARFWGVPPARGARWKRRALDWVLARRRLSAFEIDEARSLRFFDAMRRFQPTHAYGYPTLMREFVDHCLRAGRDGRDLKLRSVLCTGELLSPPVRSRLREFFGCAIVNEYGCTESGILAVECEHGTSHQIPVAAYAEVIDAAGAAAPPGQVGEVIVTDLFGSVLPLVRYRLHDRASRGEPDRCPCGRDLPSLLVEEGRVDSFIQTPHRGPVYDAILAYTVPPSVLRFRAFQRAVDHLEVHVIPGAGFEARTPAECRQRWEEALGPGMTVEVQVVDEIPYAVSGKLQYFVPMATPGGEGSPPDPAGGGDTGRAAEGA
jgi:phenylacetate-CoA ligase